MLAAGEETAFVAAVLRLKNVEPSIITQAQALGATNRYDDYVWLHLAAFSLIHTGPAFGPWHREMLRQFELDLRATAGDDSLYIPYWDWPNGNDSGDAGWPFTPGLMGGLGTGAGFLVETGPFAEAGGNWPIRVTDPGDPHTGLRRVASTNPASTSIPSATTVRTALSASPYDSVPYNATNFPSAAEAAASFRKSLEFFLHNGPHNWVGNEDPSFLDMMTASSPNDPIFFLHHAEIDRIWQIWQERQGVPPGATFVPTTGASPGHNRDQVMDIMDPSYFNFPVRDTNAATLDLHAAGVWYDTDVPELSLSTPTVDFGSIPAGMTTYRPVQFSVQGCREMRFRITGVGGAGYFIPPGNALVPFPAATEPDARTADVFLAATAPSDGSPLGAGTAVIEAFVLDDNGYLTGTPGSEFIIGTYNVTLSATVQPRQTSAVAFVSDRSGSMRGTAGGGFTKFEILEEALEVATDLLESTDSAALVFFDGAVSTPMPMASVGGGSAVAAALADPAIQPQFGSTAVGAGLIEGAAQLNGYVPPSGVTDPNLALVCLTDGNENVAPLVESTTVQSAIATYTNDLYAIGFGTEDNVSADTLGAISNYMLVTGERSVDVRRFMVTKYFAQIIADIKRADIIVDPEGVLVGGEVHEVHCDVSEADVELEVVLVSPHAKLIAIEAVTPGGDVVSAGALGSNASLRTNRLDAVLRIGLPALPGAAASSHAGRWTIRVHLADPKGRNTIMAAEHSMAKMVARARAPKQGLPYAVFVQTRSNLSFDVGKQTPRVKLGGALPIAVTLSQFGLPLVAARIEATVVDPHGHTSTHRLDAKGGGRFEASIPAPLRGVYQVRLVAHGSSRAGFRFTREATRTFAVGKPVTIRPTREHPQWCDLVACLLRDRGLAKQLEALGVDLERLRACLGEACGRPDEPRPGPCAEVRPHGKQPPAAAVQPDQVLQLLRSVVAATPAPSAASAVEHVQQPQVDPALFSAPMFMPVMAWNDKGEVEHVGGHAMTGAHDKPHQHPKDR